jgi:hypothetical protein
MSTESILQTATISLERLQQFDVTTLGREADLGKQMNFSTVTKSAEAIIDIYKRIPLTALNDFSDEQLNVIISQALADFNLFEQILNFDSTANDAFNTRTNLINAVNSRRDALFNAVWQFISYGVARITNTSILETEARATIQSIKDQSDALTAQLNISKNEADSALSAIRAVAAEHGVSQQASYFKQEVEDQENLAKTWLTYTLYSAVAIGAFAILSLFLHKFDWIKPQTNAEMFQLISSKFLIFAVLGFLLLMAARNYATHKHNAVVNRHRQNALLTYRALVEASTENGTQDIVLAHAASCIFSPQDTGFSNGKNDSSTSSKSVLELMTRNAARLPE